MVVRWGGSEVLESNHLLAEDLERNPPCWGFGGNDMHGTRG